MTATTYPVWRAGMKLTLARLQAMRWTYVLKTADETVTSSTTMQNDNDLVIPVEANATYYARVHLAFGGLSGADIKTQWTVPTGTTGLKFSRGPEIGTTDRQDTNMISAVHNLTTVRNYGCMSTLAANISGEAQIANEFLRIVTSSTAGNVQLQWAQNTSNATGTVMRGDPMSFIMWKRVA